MKGIDPVGADLLSRAQAGDRGAITSILELHLGPIRRFVARMAPDPATADDLAQEVFLTALRSLDRIDPEQGIQPYLFGVARNLVRQAWRKRLLGKSVSADEVYAAIASRTPESEGPNPSEDRLRALRECLGRLAPRALETLLRHYRDDLQCEEIARKLGIAPSNVRSTLTRARQVLRDCIEIRLKTALS